MATWDNDDFDELDDFDEGIDNVVGESLITKIFSKEELKMLFYHACRVDIPDNNDKAEMMHEILGDEFQELGVGTNRAAFLYTPNEDRDFKGGAGLIYIIALDRRGFVDNFTEFKRSNELGRNKRGGIKAYETNILILIEEYVTLMDSEEFIVNEHPIKSLLAEFNKTHIFADLGFDLKNHENYGYRENGEIVALDLGYVYPKRGNEHALTCPKCGAELKNNANYTSFKCSNPTCGLIQNFLNISRRLNFKLEEAENAMLSRINSVKIPDLGRLTQ